MDPADRLDWVLRWVAVAAALAAARFGGIAYSRDVRHGPAPAADPNDLV